MKNILKSKHAKKTVPIHILKYCKLSFLCGFYYCTFLISLLVFLVACVELTTLFDQG